MGQTRSGGKTDVRRSRSSISAVVLIVTDNADWQFGNAEVDRVHDHMVFENERLLHSVQRGQSRHQNFARKVGRRFEQEHEDRVW